MKVMIIFTGTLCFDLYTEEKDHPLIISFTHVSMLVLSLCSIQYENSLFYMIVFQHLYTFYQLSVKLTTAISYSMM